jgi:hypothetical protein
LLCRTTAQSVGALKLADEISDELEVLCVVEKLKLEEGLVLRMDCLVQLSAHILDECLLGDYHLLDFDDRVRLVHDFVRVVHKR